MSQKDSKQDLSWLDTARPELAGIVYRNVHLMKEMRAKIDREQNVEGVISDAITRFIGSMPFVYSHCIILTLWISSNHPFSVLAMAASVEAIFISTFVLIRQNRAAKLSEKRSELDLQMSLLTEHEVTRVLSLVDAIAQHLRIEVPGIGDVPELKKDVVPEKLIDEIEKGPKSEAA